MVEPTKHKRSFNRPVALNGGPYRKSNPHALMVESCVCRKPRFGKFVMRYKKEAALVGSLSTLRERHYERHVNATQLPPARTVPHKPRGTLRSHKYRA
jgi:hypothetical protein